MAVLPASRLSPPRLLDGLVAVGLLVGAVAELSWQSQATAPYLLAAAGVSLPVAAVRRAPLGSLVVAMGSAMALVGWTGRPLPGLGDPPHSITLTISWLVLVVAAGAHRQPRRAYTGLGVAVAGSVALAAAAPSHGAADVLAAMLFSVVVPWLGGALWRRRADSAEQTARADRAELAASVAVADERARIARELHDVVAHNVSMMVVQAEAADVQLEESPQRVRESLHSIRAAGRDSLGEMRRLLGMVRDDSETRTPQPTLGDVAALVEQVRAAGLPVDLDVQGEPVALPAGIGLSAYRIVQESLTNALRHSDRAGTRVLIRYRETAVEVEIEDRGIPRPHSGPAGHGLVGVRERVAMCGGVLDIGPMAERGFLVRAVLPLHAG